MARKQKWVVRSLRGGQGGEETTAGGREGGGCEEAGWGGVMRR